jgi:histidine ammonia-lyase
MRAVTNFWAYLENWQAILSSEAAAVSQAGEIAPYPEDFSRRIEEAYLDVARRQTKLVGKVRGRGLQKLS